MENDSRTYFACRRPSIAALGMLVVIALGQCGCTTSLSDWLHNGLKVGPNYHQPPAPVPEKWVDQDDPRVHHGDPNISAWWDVFDDPILTGLIQRSYSRNLTVRAAGFQILQARAQQAIALGELFPQTQGYSFQLTRAQASGNQGSAVGLSVAPGLALAPAAVLAGVPTATTPIAGVTPATGTTTTTGTSPTVGSSIGGGLTPPGVSAG